MDLILKYFPNLTAEQIRQFSMLADLYTEWNAKINVVSRKDIDKLYLHHVLHSLAIAKVDMIRPGENVLDVGCGGGFPGIPLAILYPDTKFTMVDSIGKKIKVVSEVSQAIGLKNVLPINTRCETLEDAAYDWVISRAVTDLKTFVGWSWRKTIHGILYLKGGDLTEEIRQANVPCIEVDISDFFEEDFFETKKVLVLSKGKKKK